MRPTKISWFRSFDHVSSNNATFTVLGNKLSGGAFLAGAAFLAPRMQLEGLGFFAPKVSSSVEKPRRDQQASLTLQWSRMASVEVWWKVKVDCSGLNKAKPLLRAAVSESLHLQYEWNWRWQSEYYSRYCQSIFLDHFGSRVQAKVYFQWRDVQYTWIWLTQGWNHSPTFCQDRTSKKATEVCCLQALSKPLPQIFTQSHSLPVDRGENSKSKNKKSFGSRKKLKNKTCEDQKKQVMQKHLLISSHKQNNAQPVSEQKHSWQQTPSPSTPHSPSSTLGFVTGHDITWHRVSLWPLWDSFLSCVPASYPSQPMHWGWVGRKKSSWYCACTAQQLKFSLVGHQPCFSHKSWS